MIDEKQRAIDIINYAIESVEIEIDGKSRFSIYDVNREAKRMLRYVRDQIEGTFDANWSERDEK